MFLSVVSPASRTLATCLTRAAPRVTATMVSRTERFFSTVDEGDMPTSSEGVFRKIACIGTGKMAQAILHPLIEQGVQPADGFTVFDAQPVTMQKLQEKYGVQTADSIPEALADADMILCAVKPQNLTEQFFEECRKANPTEESIFLSVIAGKPSATYERGGFSKIVRSMPNTPATIGQGMTVWSCTPNLTAQERKKIRTILSSTGKSVRDCG